MRLDPSCTECRRPAPKLDAMGLCPPCALEFLRWFSVSPLASLPTAATHSRAARVASQVAEKPPLQW